MLASVAVIELTCPYGARRSPPCDGRLVECLALLKRRVPLIAVDGFAAEIVHPRPDGPDHGGGAAGLSGSIRRTADGLELLPGLAVGSLDRRSADHVRLGSRAPR